MLPDSILKIDSLSKRECEVLTLGASGASDQEISHQLAVSVPTLRTYWLRIRDKLGAVNRTHAIALAVSQLQAQNLDADPQKKLLERVRSESAPQWAYQPAQRTVILDSAAKSLFGIATDDHTISLDRMLESVWLPDRKRIERFLLQSSELAPMTPVECRVGTTGIFCHLVRTVNLSVHRFRKSGVTVLMASAVSRTFS